MAHVRRSGSYTSASITSAAAFTLVELLVVIGIIALLISILMPSLQKARESANAVKCGSNLRTIGQGLAQYVAENRGTFPAAYMYAGTGQTSGTPTDGYIHWSSYLYGDRSKRGSREAYASTSGWDAFVCPSFDQGGLPPTNTFDSNVGEGVTVDAAGIYDQQAPRLAYTVNEAIMPRNKFSNDFDGTSPRCYQFVKAGTVKGSARTILATEFTPNAAMVAGAGRVGGGQVSKSHRPVHAFFGGGGTWDMHRASPGPGTILRNYDLAPDGIGAPAPNENRLLWIGRNHGKAKVNGSGQDVRTTNFLYVDGHVENKRLAQTLYPEFQWGDQFYSLRPSIGLNVKIPTPGQLDDLK